ncbi:hypothetical protein VAS14_20116 [Vibrio angustum S14]|uniref:Uncharacterized protein n=1 Tax=Photobacterium angustum (strain S14 / CCUG 15956) TaxID=314292 RepID=Q1ZNH0_PHOAS|nr:hypothetical protein VAS14_20116 [Vibrio angustum S14] [Photobacterium angustum S14]
MKYRKKRGVIIKFLAEKDRIAGWAIKKYRGVMILRGGFLSKKSIGKGV